MKEQVMSRQTGQQAPGNQTEEQATGGQTGQQAPGRQTREQGREGLARVALVGRRNVGKSTLLNAVCGHRRAITDQQPGLTRDIIEIEVVRQGAHFLLSDLPGLDVEQPDSLEAESLRRARSYIHASDLLLVLLEAPAPSPYDLDYIQRLRRSANLPPSLYLVNKVDVPEQAASILAEFYQAGIAALPISARGRWNLKLLLERMIERQPRLKPALSPQPLPPRQSAGQSHQPANEAKATPKAVTRPLPIAASSPVPSPASGPVPIAASSLVPSPASSLVSSPVSSPVPIPIALVGCPNSGKSSLFNCMIARELSLVSDIPNTTRDSIDTLLSYRSAALKCIDTAGLRRQGLRSGPGRALQGADFYSMARTRRAIREARIVIHLIDLQVGLTGLDKKIAALLKREHCAVVVAFSKCDAVDRERIGEVRQRIGFLFPQLGKAPQLLCSARTGEGVGEILESCLALDQRLKIRIPAAELNRRAALWERKLPGRGGRLKVRYVVQAKGPTPTFVFFVNNRREFRPRVSAYFENCIRRQYGLEGIPLTISVAQ